MSGTGPVWRRAGDYTDIRYEQADGRGQGIAKITICRPEVRNAFRPQTLFELSDAFNAARDEPEHRGDHPHRRGRRGVLLGRRPAHPRRRRLHRRRRVPTGHRPAQRARPPDPDPPHAEAGGRHGRRLRDRRRPRAARRVRSHDRGGQRAVRPDRPAGRLRSTGATGRASSLASSGRRRRARSGSCASSTTRSRHSRWAS